ncbi:trypsin-like serine peptidase [Bacillus thuringiensis]|uniref:trypsin-like serine peptidase n=1 Tax=Bacillus thuringiensis TaxID=1428 RepID=UPI000BFA1F8E|nr:serine protease [Bacillus thuringiensis]PFN46180.1 hypothetical protein COJ56_00245 [Bacillus thuringiensis]
MSSNIKIYNKKEIKDTLEYWTPERIARAKPTILPKAEQTPENLKETIHSQVASIISKPSSFSHQFSKIGEPYKPDLSKLPFLCGGKIFYEYKGEPHSGSAQFVGSCHTILTAAHCVINRETGEYHKHLRFSLNHDGENPEENVFVFDKVGVPNEYLATKSPTEYDFAFCRTTKDFSHWLGFAKRGQGQKGYPTKAMGYPENYGDTNHMYAVDGTRGEVYDLTFEMLDNPMKDGSSGGAHMMDITLGSDHYENMVIGLTATAPYVKPIVKSPIFDEKIESLFYKILDRKPCN